MLFVTCSDFCIDLFQKSLTENREHIQREVSGKEQCTWLQGDLLYFRHQILPSVDRTLSAEEQEGSVFRREK